MKLFGWLIPWWAYAIAGALYGAAMFGAGFQVESWRWSAAELHAVKKQDKAAQKQRDHANNESGQYEQDREVARVSNDARQAKVRVIYRDRPTDRSCEPPVDAKRLLDDALADANRTAGKPGTALPGPSR